MCESRNSCSWHKTPSLLLLCKSTQWQDNSGSSWEETHGDIGLNSRPGSGGSLISPQMGQHKSRRSSSCIPAVHASLPPQGSVRMLRAGFVCGGMLGSRATRPQGAAAQALLPLPQPLLLPSTDTDAKQMSLPSPLQGLVVWAFFFSLLSFYQPVLQRVAARWGRQLTGNKLSFSMLLAGKLHSSGAAEVIIQG